ncbi:transglutaminase domain-containing protein [Humibacillus xanthopallidus]|uniref:Transglutaminase superfamily protein n=1 Tax=Humibacillus xanthopallidus TaxID=412689 RepID=A0A543H9Y2_9MICO|nr:transglutaminase-like domain-containing protein [Humibacillus xanthopallidus]TQM55151.1 transglutaminase superfamily protein [Humibacillus xanthopallidus]
MTTPAGSSIPAPPPSVLQRPPTFRHKATRQLARLRPTRPQLVDAGFTVLLVTLALIGFRTTFFGLGWLWVGLAGLLVGLLVSHVTATYRAPGVVTLAAVAAAYLLLGGPIAVREDLVAGFLPSGATFATLVHMAVPGWKELLTALTPVDSEGPYMALAFLFGLVGSALTYAVARRWSGPVVALVAPVALLVASIVLGTLTPAAVLLQGAVFALAAIGWAALRSNRNRPALQNGAGRTTRAVTTAALLAAATVGGFFIGPHLPGADDTQRTVFRTALTPPVDVTQFASPLAGFRQYTEPNPARLWDRTLLVVQGLPAGVPVRFAALDSYDNLVWGAGNQASRGEGADAAAGSSFRKVGSHIASEGAGQEVTATVTVPAGGYRDVWLPTFGTVTGLDFAGSRGDVLADELRFNVDTDTGVLPTRLAGGDAYTVTARVSVAPAQLPTELDVEEGQVDVDVAALGFLDDKVAAWTDRVDGQWEKFVAMARAMQDGAYTDGGSPGDYQNSFLPGHGLARLQRFMKSTQLAGNDEQYASALALAANRLGIPTRVVVGAMPEKDGTVKGKDVHAWVEVRTTDGVWQPVLQTAFLPDRNKKPQQLLTKSEEKKTGAQVPPPAANNPPSVLQGPDQAQNATQLKNPPKDDQNPLDPSTWPDWLRYLLFLVVLPLLVLLLVYASIRLAKGVRRRRRRTRGATASQVTGGWRELVDTARDLRMPLPIKGTRLEQARALEEHVLGPPPEKPSPVVDGALMGAPAPSSAHFPRDSGAASPSIEEGKVSTRRLELVSLAASANAHVFDLDEPTPDDVEAFWADVETARQRIRAEQGFWQRLRGDVSLRTFRDHLPDGGGLGPALRRTSRSQGSRSQGSRGRGSRGRASRTTAPARRSRRGQKGDA